MQNLQSVRPNSINSKTVCAVKRSVKRNRVWNRAKANLDLLEKGPRKEEIMAASERLKAAEAQLKLATREYNRQADLVQDKAVSSREFDIAKEKFDAATANVEVRKNELAILEAGSREEEISQAKASLEEARLAWELAKKGFRDEEITQARSARDAAAAAFRSHPQTTI